MASDNVVEYVLKINANSSKVSLKQLSGELKKGQTQLDKTGRKGQKAFKKLGATALKAKAAIGTLSSGLKSMGTQLTLLGAGFLYLLKSQADYINQLVDMSARTGIAAEQLAGLKLAAEGSGASFESVERGMDRFLPKLLEVQRGTGRTADLFNDLGVAVEDDVTKKMRDSGDVFNDVISSLGSMEDQQKANAIAMELFGRQAGGMLIQSGALQNMDQFVDKARELGPALDENGIRKAQEFQRGWAEVKLGIMSFVTELAEGITGEKGIGASLSALATKLPEWGKKVGDFFADLWSIIKPIGDLILETIEFIRDPIRGSARLVGLGGIVDAPALSFAAPGYGALDFDPEIAGMITDAEKAKARVLAELGSTPEEPIIDTRDTKYAAAAMVRMKETKGATGATNKQIEQEKILMDLIRDRVQLIKDSLSTQARTVYELNEQIIKYEKITDTIEAGKKLTGEQVLAQQNLNATLEKKDKAITAGLKAEKDAFKNINQEYISLIELLEKTESQLQNNEIGAEEAANEMERIALSIAELKKESEELDLSWIELMDPNVAEAFRSSLVLLGDGLDQSMATANETIDEALDKLEKLAQTKISLNIAANILDIAGGDIVGGVSNLFGQLAERGTVSQGTSDLVGGVGSIVTSLEQLGSQLAKAEDEALDKYINELVIAQEKASGKKLSDEEIKAIENGLSSSEVERIKEQGRKDMVRARLENMASFISLAITELPIILLEVLPPMLTKLGANIIQAIFQLPGRLISGIVNGFIEAMKMLGQIIGDFFGGAASAVFEDTKSALGGMVENVGNFFGGLFGGGKRQGGRFISARSGIRFTGMRDQMAQLHRNEFVVSESGAMPQGVKRIMNERGGGGGGGVVINIHADVVERNAIDSLIRKIERQYQNFGTSTSTLFGETA